ncbi:hypothetical protein [Burkholderia multivorans]|uniref:hypothetical protein n=1 Tax=Burkholderia multivorans TaxID=87883 RepID=UPI000B5A405C|nr:hypothetical protein [Burkholderia multivorans]
MICRIWHGRTTRDNADEYEAFLNMRAVPDYKSVAGNIGVAILRHDDEVVTHFLTVTHWENVSSIRSFAGNDILTAKYYPEDQAYLLEFEPFVQHFIVTANEDVA